MKTLSIHDLKGNTGFLEHIRWDVTPKTLFEPQFVGTGKKQQDAAHNIDGYMFYVEVVKDKPILVIMKNRYSMSRTVAYVKDIPEDLLRESSHCTPTECVAGMYPLSIKLKEWLKKTLGFS